MLTLNRVDWPNARAALLREGRVFRAGDASEVGTWALIDLLRATGDPADAREAAELAAKSNDSKSRRWRLVEKYCSTDPCDPGAVEPANVASTAREYESTDVSTLYSGPWKGAGEHFLEVARPGVVRFEPQVAVETQRRFIDDVLKRRGLSLTRGLFVVRPHSALLSAEAAVALVSESEHWRRTMRDMRESRRWCVSQERLLLAFPKLGGEEQVKALLRTTIGDEVLRSLLPVMKPVEETIFDRYFQRACVENDVRRQYFLLVFASGSGTGISHGSRERLASLVTAESASVRMIVFERILHLQDEDLMRVVVDGGWHAENATGRDSYENAYGSAILVEGALRGWISEDEALQRMSPGHYGWAARRLGSGVAPKVAGMVDASIRKAVGQPVERTLPSVEYGCRLEGRVEPYPCRVGEREQESDRVGEALKQGSDSDGAFEERQKRRHEAFEAFRRRMDDAGAWIVVDDIAKEEFEAVANADTEIADRWCRLFLNLEENARGSLHHVVLMLAYALRKRCPSRTVALLRLVERRSGWIRYTVGRARVPLEAMVAWSAADSDVGHEYCHERLNMARHDHELATEVLGGLLSREERVLGRFIRERLSKGEPEGIARALLVAGFSSQGDQNKDVLGRYRDAKGFIGEAYKAARYAHDRDGWARYWFEKMCEAERPTEFWRYSVLFTKIVDGRFTIWSSEYERRGEPMELFGSSIGGEVDKRIEKWRKHREKTLFGAKKPAGVFLPQ